MTLEEAKEQVTIHILWNQLGLSGKPRPNMRSPFRKDRNASFSVYRNGKRFKDFATGEGGDVIDFLKLATGLDTKEACKRLLEIAGNVPQNLKPIFKAQVVEEKRELVFPSFLECTKEFVEDLSQIRNLNEQAVRTANERGFLFSTEWKGQKSWLLTDSERINAQIRRMDDLLWEEVESKSWTIKGSSASWPIGIKEASKFQKIVFTEGAPDFLAAFHFIDIEDKLEEVAPVCIFGAKQRIHSNALQFFSGKQVRIIHHVDEAGYEAAELWEEQISQAGGNVTCFDLSGLIKADGSPVKDLNDLTSIHADCFEGDRDLWEVMP